MMSSTKQVTAECDIINCDNFDSVIADTKRQAKELFKKKHWKFNGRHSYCPECMKNRRPK